MADISVDADELRKLVRQEVAQALRQLAAQLDAGLAGRPAPAGAAARLDPRMVAVLTAAAVAAIRRPVRVKRITFINHNTISGWAEMGRMAIQTSHNIHRAY